MYGRAGKRLLDIVFSLVMMAALSWLFVFIALVYFISGHRNILYVQERIGWREKVFKLYKFRTLIENDLVSVDVRQFPLGSFLRRTSLDELPQLWNILKGNLSFIGPRPLLVEYLPLYSPEQRLRHRVRPGITGWAQVNGRHSISWQQKFDLDLYYVRHLTFWLDAKIFVKTLLLIFSLEKDRSLQEKKFSGNA